VFEGTFTALKKSGTRTGKHLAHRAALKTDYREANGHLLVEKATLNNLRNVTAKIPKGVLTVVTGVAGSGKISLIHGCLVPLYPDAVVVDHPQRFPNPSDQPVISSSAKLKRSCCRAR
jgi:excinuclease UvrABC ATPase subunit